MILQFENWHLGYAQMLQDCRQTGGSVLIICNPDVDALAAARILSYMLRMDGIQYELKPCYNYTQLQQDLTTTTAGDNVELPCAIVLMNLGANRNLTRLSHAAAETKIYVMDCRRPVHLANVHAGENVVVFWDDLQPEDVPSDGDNLSGRDTSDDESDSDESDDSSSSEEEEDSDDEEQEFNDDDQIVGRSNDDATNESGDANYDGETEDNQDDDDGSVSSQRRKKQKTSNDEDDDTESTSSNNNNPDTQQTTATLSDLHQERKSRLRTYYADGSFYGSPAAFLSYTIATQLRFGHVGELLWLACVGVTDAHLSARIDLAGYTTMSLRLQQACRALFPSDSAVYRAEHAVFAEDLQNNNNTNNTKTRVSLSEAGRILAETDFRFFLLRHSSLMESITYSPYVFNKLKLWTNQGRHQLQELLAKMGLPLEECRQPYAFLKPTLKRTLRDKMNEYGEDYGLDKLEFTSFVRVTGYKSLLSASDTSYAVTALLECETSASEQEEQGHEENEAFYIALEALNCNSTSSGGSSSPKSVMFNQQQEGNLVVNGGSLTGPLGVGIRMAINLQKNIIETAIGLDARNAITRLRHFRYAYITSTSQGQEAKDMGVAGSTRNNNNTNQADESASNQNDNVFAKPLALTKLAYFIMDMHRDKWMGASGIDDDKSQPLVLLAERPATKTFLCAGYEYPEHAGHLVKNRFGQHFELAAKTMNGDFRFDSVDSHVVEVAAEDVQRFIEQLHYMLDSTE